MPALTEDAETALVYQDVLNSEPEHLDPPQSVKSLEHDEDLLRSASAPVERDQLVSR
jgi:hypothetical protein